MTTYHISPDKKRRKCSNPENCRYGTAITVEAKKGGSYYGGTIDSVEISHIIEAWEEHVGKESAEKMKNKKQERDGAAEYHMTFLSPKETRMLKKNNIDVDKFVADSGNINIVPQGVGKQVDEQTGNETWFIVAASPKADELRAKLHLPKKDHHITLGFTEKDIHGVPKDADTIVDSAHAQENEDQEVSSTGQSESELFKNVELTKETLQPAAFEEDNEGNVVIGKELREKIKSEIDAGYINASASEDGRFVMLKYSASAMYGKKWNEATVNCRGILVDSDINKVYARGFTKFFNASEHEKYDAFPDLPKDEKVVLAKKMDGSLGLISHIDGENRIFTSGSSRRSDITTTGENTLQEEIAKRGQPNWKPPKNVTVLAEVIDPDVNPIVVEYPNRKIVVLGAVDNKTGKDVPVESLNIPLEHVEKIDNGREMTYEEAISTPIDDAEEGYVLEFQGSGLRAKVKGDAYLASHRVMTNMSVKQLWRHILDGSDQETLDSIKKSSPDRAYLVASEAHKKLIKQKEDKFNERKEAVQRAFKDYGVNGLSEVPSQKMGDFTGHLRKYGSGKSDFHISIFIARGMDSKANQAILKGMEPKGSKSIVSLVSAEDSNVGDSDDDFV